MAQLSVLIADDNEPIRVLLANALQPHFALHPPVADGKELVESVRALAPDVIVTDVWMPRCTGLEALHTVRWLGRTTPFVMVSADADIGPDCLEAGAAAFVCKMDIERDLVAAVLAACDNRTSPSADAPAASVGTCAPSRSYVSSPTSQVLRRTT